MKFSFLIGFLWASISLAAIPKASLILQKTAENAGNGVYQIDQEVQFPNGPDTLVLRESWMIENSENMKLVVTGSKEMKDQVSFYIQVVNGIHSQTKKRVSEDFIERYFHIRSLDTWAQVLTSMKLVPPGGLSRHTLRNLKDAEYQPENFVRLARSGGVVTYAFGGIALQEKDPTGFWIEQDQFVLRKFRLPSGVEVTADKFSSYPKGLNFPRTRTVRWGSNQVTIQTISVTSRTKEAFASFGQKAPTKMDALNSQPAAALVDDFYKRFR
jgi:hypothetical protein